MHPTYVMPDWVKARVLNRQGKLAAHDSIDASRAALVVVDMQNYFVSEQVAHSVPLSRGIVPNINRMARAMRAAGGTVIWVQTTATGALQFWANHHKHQLTPERVEKRLAGLAEGSEGFQLYGKLEPLPSDLRVKKVKYSALIPDSGSLFEVLKSRGIESLLITGTATNVCCESTARDAMLLDFRVVMLSDGNATWTDEEQNATLNNCALFFGDVLATDEAIARLVPAAQRKTA
jgi:ureidoacrylate peracid hydrolase